MTTANKHIKVASILYLISSLLVVPFVPMLGSVLLILGIILLADSLLVSEELKKNKVSLIIISVISFLLNIPAAIFIILAIGELDTIQLERSNAPPATSESKKIDLLLKLGLVMILISGILFATTTWEIISNLVKVIALVGMGAAFLGLSKFSEVKLRIPSTTKAYYILGLSFFLLTWVGVGYFGVISPWFSYTGEGKNLVYFITLILLGGFLYLVNYKFKEKEYLYMGHMSIYISFYHLLSLTGLGLLEISIILSLISFIINLIPNNKTIESIKEINYTISWLFSTLVLTQCFEANKYVVLIACIINLINLVYLGLTSKSNLNQVLSVIVNYSLLIIGTLKLNIVSDNAILLFTVISVFSLLMKYQKINQSKWLVSTSQIIYNIISTILLIILANYSEVKAFIIATIYLVINVINSLDLYKNNEQIDMRYQPVVIFSFYLALTALFNEKVVYVGEMLAFSFTTFTYAIIYHLTGKQSFKNYYFVVLLVMLGITYLFNLIYGEIVVSLTTLLLMIYVYFTRKKEEKIPRILIYIAILLAVLSTTANLAYYEVSWTIINVIQLVIFIALTILIKEETFKKINYISIVIPLYSLVHVINIADNVQMVLSNFFWLYVLFLVIKFFISNKEAKDIVATIGLSVIIASIIFVTDILVGLYIGLLSIILIFTTFNSEHLKKLFYCNIVITMLNIVVQLWEFWTQIPFYLYLLLVGIALIAFVTYKELHKKDNPQIPVKQNNINNQVNQIQQPVFEQPVQNQQPQYQQNNKVEEEEEVEQLEEPQEMEQQAKQQTYTPTLAGFCPACGRKNEGGKFCRSCGRNLQL